MKKRKKRNKKGDEEESLRKKKRRKKTVGELHLRNVAGTFPLSRISGGRP